MTWALILETAPIRKGDYEKCMNSSFFSDSFWHQWLQQISLASSWAVFNVCYSYRCQEASISSNFLVFWFVLLSFFLQSLFPRPERTFSDLYNKNLAGLLQVKIYESVWPWDWPPRGFLILKLSSYSGPRNSSKLPCAYSYQSVATVASQSWLLSSVSICLSRFEVMVCPVSTVLWWIDEKSLISLCLARFFPLVVRTSSSFPVEAEVRRASAGYLILPQPSFTCQPNSFELFKMYCGGVTCMDICSLVIQQWESDRVFTLCMEPKF